MHEYFHHKPASRAGRPSPEQTDKNSDSKAKQNKTNGFPIRIEHET
jgi:hypothetical protein